MREADWDRQLPRWIAEERRRAAEGEEQAWRQGRAADAEALLAFVTALREALGSRRTIRSWADWVGWCHERLDAWFGVRLHRLEGDERIAWEQTQRVLDRLRHLDRIGGPVTRGEFRTTFVAELDLVPARRGTIGDGVHVGTLAGARGLDLDLAVVVGGADGLLPPPPTTDPLLGDEDRVAAGLVGSEERVRNAHRQFLAVVGTTPAVTIVAPRGDLRATAVHHRSRWITPLLDGLAGGEVVVDSRAQGLAATEFPHSGAEHRLRELWVSARSGGDIRRHPLVAGDVVLERALALRDGRAADVVTVYDGDLTSRPVPAFDRPIAPTRIEAWAACPHAYFVRYLLGVAPVDEPAELLDLSPLDRGSAIHAAIDALQREVLDGRLPAPGDDGWSDEHAAALRAFLETICDDLEHGGRTGRAAYWATSRLALAAELDGWVRAEREHWEGRRLLASEHRFVDDATVSLALADGRAIAFRGSIERVDRLPDGTLVVTDHKTGSVSKKYKDLKDDPTAHGLLFQLPVYAAAARALDGRPDALVRAEYAFFAKAKYERLPVVFDDAAWKLTLARLADVVDGIEARLFPATPEPPGWRHHVACPYCEPDELGTTERFPEWERKRHDPRLARWFGEDGGDVAEGDDG